MTNLIKHVDYIESLRGFMIVLNDDRIVLVQFDKETNRLSADYDRWFPMIYREYSAEITEEEKKEILNHKDIIAHACGLDDKDKL